MEQAVAEQATGIVQRGSLGKFYPTNAGDDPAELSPELARSWLEDGQAVAVPNAGAGSYREFFSIMGFVDVETVDNTSSAGDWTFGLKRADGSWVLAFQSNRYPRHGFEYSINPQHIAGSFEVLCASME